MALSSIETSTEAGHTLCSDIVNTTKSTSQDASHIDIQAVKKEIDTAIEKQLDSLGHVNRTLWENPELAWNETIAHDTISSYLEELGFQVVRHAYGLKTAFEARAGSNGRLVNFNAEYDALPDLGHACGHNLIATSSITGFLALASALKKFGIEGRVQLLGTPAEESGGGKINLIEAGAFKDGHVSLMGHPFPTVSNGPQLKTAAAGFRTLAQVSISCEFRGKSAHAGAQPWDGVNALDAVVAAYNSISMLRQQLRPEERVHGCILEAPKVTNIIPDRTKIMFTARSTARASTERLAEKLKHCFQAAGMATGCEIHLEQHHTFADLRINDTLCQTYQSHMLAYGEHILKAQDQTITASTDQGNVSYVLPALHSMIGIPCPPDVNGPHTKGFATACGKEDAFDCAIRAGKAMALTGWDVLTNNAVFEHARADFEEPVEA